jgi:hypothetical protein
MLRQAAFAGRPLTVQS